MTVRREAVLVQQLDIASQIMVYINTFCFWRRMDGWANSESIV